MTGGTMVYSPGYRLPAWLGRGQLRLWRHVERELAGKPHTSTTVRAIATELGVNPGSVSRDLDALARLGLAVHHAAWGRRGVLIWRVVARGGRRGWDLVRRRRALARMGVALDGQLSLAFAESREPEPVPSAPAPHAPPAVPPPPAERSDSPEPFATVICRCGKLRLIRNGDEPSPCPHPPARSSIWDEVEP